MRCRGNLSILTPPPCWQVNLFLRVVRRRDDGYHDLASLFHVIDLGDGMEFTLLPDSAEKDELRCDMAGVPTDDSNLVIKAGRAQKALYHVDASMVVRKVSHDWCAGLRSAGSTIGATLGVCAACQSNDIISHSTNGCQSIMAGSPR